MDVESYLERIADHGSTYPTPATLTRLHLAHLFSVPFENLDIPLGRPIELSIPSFHDKIVRRRRGGFCYGQNGLFGWLLTRLGFRVDLLSARVFQQSRPGEKERPGPQFDHMCLLVDTGTPWLADVGFGDSFLEPMPLHTGERHQHGRSYRLCQDGDSWTLQQRPPASDWQSQYVFELAPHALEEFAAMCRFHQTSPESTFTRKSVCSLATPEGRITLSNGRWITTIAGQREERDVTDTGEYRVLLAERFGIDLGDEAPLDRLVRGASRA